MEICQRCKVEGPDRRTLYMECLYDMSELGLPFEQVSFKAVQTEGSIPPHPLGFDKIYHNERIIRFFTLRVCKDCRSAWMAIIKQWFDNPAPEDSSFEDGAVYLRELGTSRKATEEEIEQLRNRL